MAKNEPAPIDTIFQTYDRNLYKLSGDETPVDQVLDIFDSGNNNANVNNSSAVAVDPALIGSGVGSSNTVNTGNQAIGKTTFDNTQPGYILGVDPTDKIAKFYIGNSTNYLNWDGTNLNFTGRLKQTLKFSTIFENSTRFSGSSGLGATVTYNAYGVVLDAGTTAHAANLSADVWIDASPNVNIGDIPIFSNTSFSTFCTFNSSTATTGSNGIFYIGVHGRFGNMSDTSGVDQYGFKFVKTNGTVALYATCGQSTGAETATLINSNIALTTTLILSAVCNIDSSVTFTAKSIYGTLINFTTTHTTNIPLSTGVCNRIGTFSSTNLNTAYNYAFYVSNYTFEMFSSGLY